MLYCLLVASVFINPAISLYCYWNTGCPYKYLSTETPYDSVRGDIRDSLVKLTGCEPISVWAIYRHGKRHPDRVVSEHMERALAIRDLIISSYEKHHSSLCAQDVDNLRNWKSESKLFNVNEDLTQEGVKEMTGLGKRLKEAFPTLLGNIGHGNYTFRPAKGSWTERSIKYFVKGLGDDNIKIDDLKPDSDVMAPYGSHGHQDIQQDEFEHPECKKFLNTPEYLAVKDRIQRRSGIEYKLSDVNVSALYDLCRYTWSNNVGSPWCALFTTEDLQVLEYGEDMKHYYRNGYGTQENEIVGRVPLADLYKMFVAAKDNKGKKIVAYVTHATMLDQIYTALGLFKDASPLIAASRSRDRKWRTSKLSVFSANLLAVLNRCEEDDKRDYNIVFYLNEEPIVTYCAEGVCSWDEFEEKLRPFVNTTLVH